MTTANEFIERTAGSDRQQRRERRFVQVNRAATYLNVIGFGWLVPLIRMAIGDSPKAQIKELWQQLAIPLIGIAAFLTLWATLAPMVNTSLGAIPGPAQVWEQAANLADDHYTERAKETAFY